jgi:hypothetical protein
MDALGNAARALRGFDPLEALRHVALRSDPSALALRGIAMAQLGEFATARALLTRAAKAFGGGAPVARARCVVARAEIALACRDLGDAERDLDAAASVLEARGDVENALFARLQSVRRLVLLGELRAAERALAALELRRAPPLLVTVAELAAIDIAVRSVRARDARLAVERARAAARAAAVPSLTAEVEHAARTLDANVARLRVSGAETAVRLDQVEDVFRSRELVVDACRREVRSENVVVPLIARPVLLALAVTLAESSPAEATREALARRAFGARAVTESVRARLRVEIGRLRRVLGPLADVRATLLGFSLVARRGKRVLVLLPPDPGESSAVLALLGGEPSWSTSGLARALGKSQRTVQRALGLLLSEGRVEAVGKGSARRWMAAAPTSFATTMLLLFRDSLD